MFTAVAGLAADAVASTTSPSDIDAAPVPWSWLRMPHQEKADRLGELGDWVADVLFAWLGAQRAVAGTSRAWPLPRPAPDRRPP